VGPVCRAWLAPILLIGWLLMPALARGQLYYSSRFELPEAVALDQTDSATRTHLERVRACLADEQWDEAVETLRQIMENQGGKVIHLSGQRYGNLRDFCHLRISALPSPALDLYRDRVDPQARQWYEEAVAGRDVDGLRRVVDRFFCSTWGDNALLALGELALEQADYPLARACWERLIPAPPTRIPGPEFEAVRRAEGLPAERARLLDRWYRVAGTDESPYYLLTAEGPGPLPDEEIAALVELWNARGLLPERLRYPQTDLPLADIRARLVLVSILEGSDERAAHDLQTFAQLHPDAEGKLAGRTGKYTDLLSGLLKSSREWPEIESSQRWNTFAGGPQRNGIGPPLFELGELRWKIDLPRYQANDAAISRDFGMAQRRPAEGNDGLLSYYPLVVGDVVFVADQSEIRAYDLHTGQPAWGAEAIYKDRPDGELRAHTRPRTLGAPRFTLTTDGQRLFARMGSPITSNMNDSPFPTAGGALVCLDLSRQGSLLWKLQPDDDNWSFEGTPVVEGSRIYVAMRRSEIRPQAYVACYDTDRMTMVRKAPVPALQWRRMICSAYTPGRGQTYEITHNLLTLDRGTLYYNTNLGAVASLDAQDGQINWLTLYPRVAGGDLNKMAAHFYRDLTPCLYDRGRLFVAPSDSEEIFALNAQTGELLWRSPSGQPEDTIHLLGVAGGNLLASGDVLRWFDAEGGKLKFVWPDGPLPKGYGRGVVSADGVLWPTREEIYLFGHDSPERTGALRLAERGATGGNLLLTQDYLLIATAERLYAFGRYGLPSLKGGAEAVRESAARGASPGKERTATADVADKRG
jgi:outer membrane protein assembly factor BamB